MPSGKITSGILMNLRPHSKPELMKERILMLVFCSLCCCRVFAQQSKGEPLPLKTYLALRDSTTSLDIVFLKGEGGSLSVEGENAHIFNFFFENIPAVKSSALPDGNIMWLREGREFISGNYFLGDSTGCVVFQKDGQEYTNRIGVEGNAFLKSQGRR